MIFSRILFCVSVWLGIASIPMSVCGQDIIKQEVSSSTLSGLLVDNKHEPLSYATITVLDINDKVVNGGMSEEDGTFKLILPAGQYTLRVNAIGFEETRKSVNVVADQNLGNWSIATNVKVLSTVEVTAERAQMEMAIDKKIFNVDKNITSTGGSAADVLQNVPSVTVDPDGEVSVRGKSGVTILIDGKPATLFGGDEASALQSLPAASIESVELITNPSAKYDASGMNGIINIVLKKNKKFGIDGSVTAGIGTRNKYNGGLSLNMRNEKWNLFLNSNIRDNQNQHVSKTTRFNKADNYEFNTADYDQMFHKSWFTTLGAEYAINKKTSISFTENINKMSFGGVSSTVIRSGGQQPDSLLERFSERDGGPLSFSSSLGFKHKFNKPQKELTGDATFVVGSGSRDQSMATTYHDYDSYGAYYGPVYQNNPSTNTRNSLNAQLDYTNLIDTNWQLKMDLGAKTQNTWFDMDNVPTIQNPSGPVEIDSPLLSGYRFVQGIHAAYVNLSAKKEKWSYQAGLRAEYADYEGSMKHVNSAFENTFFSLFPSAYLMYELNNNASAYLNYSRRTRRPHFFQLTPYVDMSNPQEVRVGNPDLRPEFIHNFELNYSKQLPKGHNIMGSLYTQYSTNLIERVQRFNENGTSITMHQNLNFGWTYGAELITKWQVTRIWDLTTSFNGFYNTISGVNISNEFKNEGWSGFAKLNSNVKLPKNFSLQLMANYEAPKVTVQSLIKEMYWVDFAVRKTMFKNKANIVLNITDVFNTRARNLEYDLAGYWQSSFRKRESRVATLTFTYKFGQSLENMKRQRSNGKTPNKEINNLTDGDGGDTGF